ncbi:hypothetical protein RSAG8_00374, partial [Rhizoctonia solani AG-8 WAC10335]
MVEFCSWSLGVSIPISCRCTYCRPFWPLEIPSPNHCLSFEDTDLPTPLGTYKRPSRLNSGQEIVPRTNVFDIGARKALTDTRKARP